METTFEIVFWQGHRNGPEIEFCFNQWLTIADICSVSRTEREESPLVRSLVFARDPLCGHADAAHDAVYVYVLPALVFIINYWSIISTL